jgi:hypothetical protein
MAFDACLPGTARLFGLDDVVAQLPVDTDFVMTAP